MELTGTDFPTTRPDSLHQRLVAWRARLRRMGLDGIAGALLDAAEPLSPLGAQVLWVAQPTLRMIMPERDIDALATLLEDPTRFGLLRSMLIDNDGLPVGPTASSAADPGARPGAEKESS